MPDFERLIDDFKIYNAKTPENKAYHQGYVKGKNYARKEILLIVSIIAIVKVLMLLF